MKKYFIITEGRQKDGPFSLEELIDLKIKRKTKIWHPGLSDWISAAELEELGDYFSQSPPDVTVDNSQKIAGGIKFFVQVLGIGLIIGLVITAIYLIGEYNRYLTEPNYYLNGYRPGDDLERLKWAGFQINISETIPMIFIYSVVLTIFGFYLRKAILWVVRNL